MANRVGAARCCLIWLGLALVACSQLPRGASTVEWQYSQDIADYTEAYVVSGRTQSFLGGLGDIAEECGVSDWESHDSTWKGVGRGLARTHVNATQLEVYKSHWTGGDPSKMRAIQQAFDSGR